MPDDKTQRAEDLRTNDTTEGAQTDANTAPSAEPTTEQEKADKKNPLGYTVTDTTQKGMESAKSAKDRAS